MYILRRNWKDIEGQTTLPFSFFAFCFFRFSVSWFLFLLLSQLQLTQADKAFDGQLTSTLPTVSLSLSFLLCVSLPHAAAGVAVNVNANAAQFKVRLSWATVVSSSVCEDECQFECMYVYSLQRSFNKVAIASYQNAHKHTTYFHMKLCHQPQRSFSLFVLVLFSLIQIVVILSPWRDDDFCPRMWTFLFLSHPNVQ